MYIRQINVIFSLFHLQPVLSLIIFRAIILLSSLRISTSSWNISYAFQSIYCCHSVEFPISTLCTMSWPFFLYNPLFISPETSFISCILCHLLDMIEQNTNKKAPFRGSPLFSANDAKNAVQCWRGPLAIRSTLRTRPTSGLLLLSSVLRMQ